MVCPAPRESHQLSLCSRKLFLGAATLAFFVFIAGASSASACQQIPAGQSFRVRLLQPVATYSSKAGTLVRAFVIESPLCDGDAALPTGTIIAGHIVSVQKVGLGFRHETANLQLQFDRIMQDGSSVDMRARVLVVDNAREKVKNGIIRGNRSTKTLHGIVGNTLGYVMMWHPGSFWMIPAARATFSILPEPELYYPAGTDLLLQLSSAMPLGSQAGPASRIGAIAPPEISGIDEQILSIPERTSTRKGMNADVVNLAFVGSLDQLADAFQAAGWLSSDAPSTRNGAHLFRALISSNGYPRGPMAHQILEGNANEFAWQKGLNCVARRDHLRVWSDSDTWEGRSVWVASSTRDVGMRVSLWKKEITHRVESDIDVERERIVRDLELAGCVQSVHAAQRPSMPAHMTNATGDRLQTDGSVAVVELKDCEAPNFANPVPQSALLARPPKKLTRYFRAQVLSFRDLWRENAAYNAFDLSRMAVRSWRRNHDPLRRANAILSSSKVAQAIEEPR